MLPPTTDIVLAVLAFALFGIATLALASLARAAKAMFVPLRISTSNRTTPMKRPTDDAVAGWEDEGGSIP